MFNKNKKKSSAGHRASDAPRSPARGDAAVTAEFDYIEWDEELADEQPETPEPAPAAEVRFKRRAKSSVGEPRAPGTDELKGYNAEGSAPASAPREPRRLSSAGGAPREPTRSSAGWGFEQPQVSGVFSRYEEETGGGRSGEFDLFAEEEQQEEERPEQTLRDYVAQHNKEIRRLTKQVAYQKEIIQVISELLVESQVISRDELKRQLRALRNKST